MSWWIGGAECGRKGECVVLWVRLRHYSKDGQHLKRNGNRGEGTTGKNEVGWRGVERRECQKRARKELRLCWARRGGVG